MKMRSPQWTWGQLCCTALAALIGTTTVPTANALTPEVDIRRDITVVAIEKVMPSVVNIRTTALVRRNDPYDIFFRRFYGLDDASQIKEQPSGVGSGVIIDVVGDAAYILTNVHVVQRANRVQVQLWDGREYEAEKLVGNTQSDLALLRIVRRAGDKPFQPIVLAPDDDLLLGETVIAVGNPFGLGGSVSRGILSSKNRRPNPDGDKLDYQDWLQTDADINPGNSGGPLINVRGELIGINVAIYSPEQGKGTGFAIPVRQVTDTLSDFFMLEWHARLWLGVRLRAAAGALTVREVQEGSPAHRAGIRAGQQIIEVNNTPVRGLAEFNQLVSTSAKQHAAITILDQTTRRVVNVDPVPLPALNKELVERRLGLITTTLTETQASNYQLNPNDGWMITEVEKNGPADKAQLEAGMVLTLIDGVAIKDLVNLSKVLTTKKPGESVQVTVKLVTRYGGRFVRLMNVPVDVVLR